MKNTNKNLFIAITYLTMFASNVIAGIFNPAAAPQQAVGNFPQAVGNLPQIAVYVSEHSGYSNDEKSTLRSAAISAIQRSGRYRVVERSGVLSEELARQASSAVADDQITRFGRQAGAQLICVVDMTHLRDRREPVYSVNSSGRTYVSSYTRHKDYQVSVRMIDVETAEVLSISVVIADITSGQMMTAAVIRAVDDMLEKIQPASAGNLPKMAAYISGGEDARWRGMRSERHHNALYSWALEALFTRAKFNGTFTVVERSEAFTLQIDREHSTQRSGAVDDGQIARLGRQYGVQYVLIINMDWAGETYNIVGRVVNVETATIEAASQPRHTNRELQGLRSIAIQTVEDMIVREIPEEEREAERRAEALEERAARTAWVGMFTLGGGATLLQNEFMSTTDPDELAYRAFEDQTSGFNLHLGTEFFRSDLRFIRFGFEWDIGFLGVDDGPLINEYPDILEDSTRGGAVWRLGTYLKLTTWDYLYVKGGVGYSQRNNYRIKTGHFNPTRRDGQVGGFAYTVGGGLNIPIQTENMRRNDGVFAVFLESNYHTVLHNGRESNYMTVQGGVRWGSRMTQRVRYVPPEI